MDVGIAVEILRVVDVVDIRICTQEPCDLRIVDTAIHVDEADGVDHLVAGEAAGGFGRDRAGGIVGAVGEAPLAPGVVGEALGDGAALVGEDRDGAQMILHEVARLGRDRRAADGRLGEVLADHLAAGDEVFVPLGRAARPDELLDFDAGDRVRVVERTARAILLKDAQIVQSAGKINEVAVISITSPDCISMQRFWSPAPDAVGPCV